ncbi:hypothetical protein [Helicobacter sp. MIT 14-3879]
MNPTKITKASKKQQRQINVLIKCA